MSFNQLLRKYWPLTVSGTFLLGIALYLLGVGYTEKNGYAFTFSFLSLLLLVILSALSRIQAYRMRFSSLIWDVSHPPVARVKCVQKVQIADTSAFYFFRIHFNIRGKLKTGRSADFFYRHEQSVSRGGTTDIEMYFPLSGSLEVRGDLAVRDIFGLTVSFTGEKENRRIPVLAPVFPDRPASSFTVSMSYESSKKTQSSEEEKYYMREYMPGDRMKDINWKASFRLSEMITRISPVSPEPSKLIEIEFRNFSYLKKDTVQSLVHLNFIKSWLISFLYAMKNKYPEYRFRIKDSRDVHLVENIGDIEKLARHIAMLGYAGSTEEAPYDSVPGQEKYIFSTPYDLNYSRALGQLGGSRSFVFRTVYRKADGTKRKIRLLDNPDPDVLPGLWIFRMDRRIPQISREKKAGVVVVEEGIRATIL